MSTPPRSATPATDSTPTGATATDDTGLAEQGDGAALLASADPSTGGGGGGESSAAKARGLDDEVASLVGGFTSFWGKVKKQVRGAFSLCS